MTNKQKKFLEYYLIDSNATQAYMKAYPGVNENTAGVNGLRLLRNANIDKAIKDSQAKLKAELNITKEDLLRDLQEIKEAQKAGNSSAAIKAIEVMGRMLGFFESKLDITSKGDKISINLNLTDSDDE